MFSRLGTTPTRAVIWSSRYNLERHLRGYESLVSIAHHVGFCVGVQTRRNQFKPWTARSVDRDFRGLVKRGRIGIGFGCFFQSLDRCACRIVGPTADKMMEPEGRMRRSRRTR